MAAQQCIRRILLALTALFLLSICFHRIEAEVKYPFDRYRFRQIFPPSETSIQLSNKFLIPESEVLSIGGSVLSRGEDYEIGYIQGWVRLKTPPADSVSVYYEIFPWKLREVYYHRSLPEPEKIHRGGSAGGGYRFSPAGESGASFRFNHSGSIFRSVSMGTDRGASLDSGMELQLNGRLGKGVTVTAALSDQNIPLQPEGDTRSLEEIDKVYVSVQGERLGLNLGDYDLFIPGREFASVERKLTGAKATAAGERYEAMVSAATSKGEYHSLKLNGVEGLQGPYQLRGRDGQAGILILAGTEKVWLDGRRLTRGDDNDYIIDYSLGEITFSERVPISSDSRIVVDFQYAADTYSRSYYHSAGSVELAGERMKLTYALAREGDNRKDPLSFTLSPEAKAALRSAGDDSYQASVEGAEQVQPGEGRYLRRFNPVDSSYYFEWAGRDSPQADSVDWEVVFSYVGSGQGSYEREFSEAGEVYYRWAGSGLGEYLPALLVPLPDLGEAADLGFSYTPGPGIEAQFEAAGTLYDRNTLSDIDDGDNQGSAFGGKIRLDTLKLPLFSGEEQGVGLHLKARNVSEDFYRLDRTEEAEFYRRWGYQDTLSPREESYDAYGYILPLKGLRIGGGGGAISKEGFSSKRWESSVDYSRPEATQVRLYGEDIRMNSGGKTGYWRRANSQMWQRFGLFKPGFDFEGEDNAQGGEGFRFGEYAPSLTMTSSGRSLRLEYTYRKDEYREGGNLHPQSKLRRGGIFFSGRSRNSDYSFDYTHSVRDYAAADSVDITSDLGRIEVNSTSSDGAVRVSLQHRISQTLTPQTALVPYEVGWGEGNYVKEGEEYYPDPAGNFVLIPRETGDFTRSSKVKSSITLGLDFRRSMGDEDLPDWLRLFSSETYLSVEEQSNQDEPWRLYLLYLPDFRGDSTRYGIQSFRQDIFYRKGDRDLSFRARAADDRSLNRQLVGAGERMARNEYSFRIRKSAGRKASLESILLRGMLRRWRGEYPLYQILSYAADNRIFYLLTRRLEFILGLKLETAEETYGGLQVQVLTLNPRLDYSILRRGRISAEGSWAGVVTEAEEIPYEMTGGRGKGSNYEWKVRVSYRIGNNLNLSASYNGESKVGRPVIHSGRMELRAFF